MFNHPDDPKKIAELIGYSFKNEALLAQALTRRSAFQAKLQDKSIGDFQRLEWLGDSALNFIVSIYLEEFHKDKMEGALTQLRIKLVKNDGPLPRVARSLGLDKFIIRGPKEPLTDKKLADHMEALLGAIFLDSGKDYEVIRDFIVNKWTFLGLNQDHLSFSDFGNESLIEASDVSAKREEQLNRSLFKAVIDGEQETVDFLINQGASIEARDENGNTPILLAYMYSHYDLMRHLYDEHRANIDAQNEQGQAIIHIAAVHGDLETLEFLIENMAELNLQDKAGNPAAHLAAQNGQMKFIEKLHEAGADLSIENKLGENLKRVAEDVKNKKLIAFIDKINAKQNELNNQLLSLLESFASEFEIYYKKDEIISLVDKGADPLAKNSKGQDAFRIIIEKYKTFDPSGVLNYALLKKAMPRRRADLSHLSLSTVRNIEQVDLSETNLQSANFEGSWLVNVSFYKAWLKNVNFDRVQFTQVDFEESNISGARFSNVTMDRFSIETFILAAKKTGFPQNVEIHFGEIDLSDVSLKMFDLKKFSFHYTKFNKEIFCSVLPQLKQGIIINGTIDLRNVDLNDVDLIGVSFKNIVIDHVTLQSMLPKLKSQAVKLAGATLAGSHHRLSLHSDSNPKPVLDSFDLSNLDLSEVNLSAASLLETKLTGACLRKSDLRRCDFSRAHFSGANFESALLDKDALNSILKQTRNILGRRTILPGITVNDTGYLNLSNLDLTGATFSSHERKIEFVNFRNSILGVVNFKHIRFSGVDLRADLTGADLYDATFENVQLEGANLQGVKLSGTSLIELMPYVKKHNLSLKNVVLIKQDLTLKVMNKYGKDYIYSDIDFTGLDVEGINLAGTKLSRLTFLSLLPLVREGKVSLQNIVLEGMDLSGIDLTGIDMSGITLIDVNLQQAILIKTVLKNAKLKGINLSQAKVNQANFTDCIFQNVKTKDAALNDIILTDAHIDRPTLDGLLVYCRRNIISLTHVNLVNTKRFFPCPSGTIISLSLKGCEMSGIDLTGVTFFQGTHIDKRFLLSVLPQLKNRSLYLKGAYLDFDVKEIDFTGISLNGVTVNDIAFKSMCTQPNAISLSLSGIGFSSEVKLKKIDFSKLNMVGVNFAGVKLTCKQVIALLPLLQKNLVSLKGADLSYINLSNLDLHGIDLEEVNLQNANCSKSNLAGCNLKKAHIAGTSFIQANLDGVDLSHSTTQYDLVAFFTTDNRGETDFKDATFRQANLDEVRWPANRINLTAVQINQAASRDRAYLSDRKLEEELFELSTNSVSQSKATLGIAVMQVESAPSIKQSPSPTSSRVRAPIPQPTRGVGFFDKKPEGGENNNNAKGFNS